MDFLQNIPIPTNKITDTIATMYEYKNIPKKCKLVIINTNKIKLSILELLYLSIFIFLIFLIKNHY
jgi:hypothetical protein